MARSTADITAELIASGLSLAQTALLMELVLSMSTGQGGENRAIENRRAWDRDRKKREREASRLSAMSTGHPPDSTGLPVENADVRPTEVNKNRSLQGEERKKTRGSRLLSGARVSDENRAVAIDNGCPPDRVDGVWTEFVDYWSDIPGQRGCKLSWTGTWRNRVKSLFERTSNGNGNRAFAGAGQQSGSAAIIAGTAAAVERRARERGAGGPRRDAPGGGGAAGGDDAELFGPRNH